MNGLQLDEALARVSLSRFGLVFAVIVLVVAVVAAWRGWRQRR